MNLFSWFRRVVKRPFRKSAIRQKPSPRLARLLVEHLENRIAPATVSWNAGSGNWDNPANWSPAQVPGAGDDVVINTTGMATVTIQSTDFITVNSVTTAANDTLSFTGGQLTVAGTSPTSVLDGPLTMAGGILQASGSGTTLTANGTTTFSGTSLTGVEAVNGGTLNLPALSQISAVPALLMTNGPGSVLNVPALTSISGTESTLSDGESLDIEQGGTLADGDLTTLDYENLFLDGTGTWSSSQITQISDATLTVTGTATVTLSGVTDVDGSSLMVSGGATLNLPSVASYTGMIVNPDVSDGAATYLQASGAGSTLSLAGLTGLTGATVGYLTVTKVQALAGATVDLPVLTQISGGDVVLESDGSNSQLDVPDLTTFTSIAGLQTSAFPSTLQVTNGGTMQDGALTTLNRVNLTLDPTSIWSDSQITSAANGTINYLGLIPNSGGAGLTVDVPQFPPGLRGLSITVAGTSVSDTTINIPAFETVILNAGAYAGGTILNVGQGSNVTLDSLTVTGGATFNVGTNASVDLFFGNYSGVLAGSGPGGVQIDVGNILDNPNYLFAGKAGLTLDFPGSMFQWTGGTIDVSQGVLTNEGTVNLTGSDSKAFADGGSLAIAGEVDNFGTFNQVGADLSLGNFDNFFVNEVGASYVIGDNSGIDGAGEAGVYQTSIINAGTIRKSGGSGVSTLEGSGLGSLSNMGTIEADSGTIALDPATIVQLSGSALTGGTWSALNSASLDFPSGTAITDNAGVLVLGGTGSSNTGGSITGIAGLASNSGGLSLTKGADFTTAGAFTNSGSVTVGAGSTLTVAGNYTQAPIGALAVQIGGTPGSGQFGQLAVTGAAALAGSFNLSRVNGFEPTAGQQFNVISFTASTGSFAAFFGLAPYFTETLTSSAQEIIASSGPVELAATSVTASTTAATGQQITVNWQVSNPGTQAATGSWQDSVYVSATPAITAASVLLGAVPHNGGLAGGVSYSASLTAALPALPPGNYYVLVQVDSLYQVPQASRANNTLAASTGPLVVSVTPLPLNTPTGGQFVAADEGAYYQVNVTGNGTLVVSLQSAAPSGATALYVSAGSLPTPYNYQEAADIANQPNQTATVPYIFTPGTYYILAQSVSGAAASAAFTLTATQTGGATISAISSYAGGNGGNVTIEIDGANFTSAASASLTLGGTIIPASSIDFVNAGQMFATFDLAGATLGSYTLTVQQGGASPQASAKFQVVAAVAGSLSIALYASIYVHSGQTAPIIVTYANTSNNDMVVPVLLVSSTNADASFSTADDPNNYLQSAQVLAVDPSGPAGILRPGQEGEFSLSLLSNDPISENAIPVDVSELEPGQPLNLASQEAALRPSTISAAAWNVIFTNLTATLGATTDSYDAALAQAATYLGGLGESTPAVSDVQHLFEFLIEQADAMFPTNTLGSTTDASLPTPGNLSLAIDRTFDASIAGRYHQGIFGLGWSTSWEMSLSADSSGNVSLYLGGAQASALLAPASFFVHQSNGAYLDVDGEYGTLTVASNGSGDLVYTDPTGSQYVFFAPGTNVAGAPGGRLSYIQDTNGNRITLGYNTQGQLTTLTYANPADASEPSEKLTLSYNAQGFVSQVADGTGDVWNYAYDAAGHLLSVTAPGNLITTYTYDTGANGETANALLSITNPDGSQQNFTYDSGAGRLTSTSANGGANAITYTYQGEAEVAATDLSGAQTTVWFNDFALPARVMDPLGGISNYVYDNNGNLISYTDAGGNTYQYTYDGNGNLTQIVNPLGQTVQMTYGPLDTLTSLTDADNNSTQYSYGTTGNLLSISYPDGTQQSFSYDPLGNMTDTIEQNGDPVGYEYNAQGLVTQESFADGSSQSYTYDAHGNLLTASSFDTTGTLTGTTTLTYNAANELLSIVYPNGQSLAFTYNAQGQRTQSVDQSGYTLTYGYDALGRLISLSDGAGMVVSYTYNNLGELSGKTNNNGTYTTYAYDAVGNLINITNYAPGGSVASPGTAINSSFTYTYNLLGEQTSVTDNAGNTTTYSYDATGQLIGVGLPGGQTITYVYNAAGDRTEVVNNGTPTTYTSNSGNEITQVGSTTYTYDANGNLATMTDASGTTTYTYNDLNQLVSIANPDGSLQSFQYSPLGFMVGTSTTSGATTSQTNYLVDPTGLTNVVASYDGSGNLIANYNYGLGLVSQTGPSGTGYYDFDAAGNTVGIADSTGAYVNQYAYLPFGETTTVSAALPNSFTFAGQAGVMQIGSNLFSMRVRDYTPATGQFLSNDPTGLLGGDFNIRRYVNNNPVNQVDPQGLVTATEQAIQQIAEQMGPARQSIENQYVIDAEAKTRYAITHGHGKKTPPPQDVRETLEGLNDVEAIGLDFFLRGVAIETNRVAGDPNALVGPAGIGTQDLVPSTASLPYTIDFENDGDVAALDVTVTEQMDANLDWSTFQLGSFGFGPINVTIPAGLTQYQTTVSYENADGSALNVNVALNFNVGTGVLTVTFSSLDPATGEAPTGVFDGFLYPQAGSAAGADEGYVQYTIQPNASLPTGTAINQQASVVFDINAAIATNTVTNTIAAVVTQASLSEPVGTTTPATTKISALLGANYADPDSNTKPGIAIFGTAGTGTWQYSTNGTTWVNIAAVTTTSALLLPAADLLRFLPTGSSAGSAELLYVAWDGSLGSAGSYANAGAVGGGTPFSANAGMLTVSVTPVNHAPTWTGATAAFTPVVPGQTATESVASVFGPYFNDADGNSVGIAVIGATAAANGTWAYSTDNGITWTSFGSATTTFKVPSATNALLLAGADLIRFVPNASFSGTATLTADAWDGTQGTAAQFGATTGYHITATGRTTAFSATALTATLHINTAPTLATASITPFTAISEGAPSAVATVAALLRDAGASADATGVAIVGAAGTGGSGSGTWQYLLAGATTWTALPAVSQASGLLLPSSASVRFVSVANQNGTATLSFLAWDGTAGTAGKLFAIGTTGGATSLSDSATTGSLTVRAINHAPTWTGSTAAFTPVAGNSTPPGDLVSAVFGSHFSDIDGDPVGVAVIGATGTADGTWEYSLDGVNWTSFGSATTTFKVPSTTNALLLPAGDLIRFLPKTNFLGTATLTVDAWDGTQGTAAASAATGFKIAATGGASAFSSTPLTATVIVHDAPTLANTSPTVFPAAITEGAASPVVTVATLLADAGAGKDAKGIAIVGASGTGGSGTGTWQYHLANTTTWTNLPAVSETSGFVLLNRASIRFLSIANQNGAATLTFVAWDGSKGTPGTLLPIIHVGGGTPFSVEATANLRVNPINHAPTWTATSFALPTIASSTASPAGESITQLVGSAFADIDAVTHVGVAIIAASGGTTGTWQFYNGTSWQPLGFPTAGAARLLAGADLVRYVPNAGFDETATLTVRPWDGSTGTDYATVNLAAATSIGGNTAYGTTLASISELVHDAPILATATPTVSQWATAINEGSASPAVTVAALMHDAAVGASTKGLAIVGAGGGGNWQYLAAGSTVWTSLPSVSASAAFLVPSTASLRFLSAAGGHGTATLTFRAWDGSAGTADKPFTVTATGGATAISNNEAAVSLTIAPINHAPAWIGKAPSLTPVLPKSIPPGNTVASVFGSYFNDLDGNSVGIAVTALSGTADGTWQYSLDGITWSDMTTTGANKTSPSAALLLAGSDFIRFLPTNANFLGTATLTAYAWDGTTGSAGGTANLSKANATGGNTAFSSASLTATVLVNTAPTLTSS